MVIYIYIYIAIYTYRSGGCGLVGPFQRDCSTSPPNVGAFGSNTLHCLQLLWNQSYGNVLMDR